MSPDPRSSAGGVVMERAAKKAGRRWRVIGSVVALASASLVVLGVTGAVNATAQPAATTHALSQVAASIDGGDAHTCAVQTTRAVLCWGKNDIGQATPPAGTF